MEHWLKVGVKVLPAYPAALKMLSSDPTNLRTTPAMLAGELSVHDMKLETTTIAGNGITLPRLFRVTLSGIAAYYDTKMGLASLRALAFVASDGSAWDFDNNVLRPLLVPANRPATGAKDDSWSNCHLCSAPGQMGYNMFECTNPGCRNYKA